MNDLEFDRAMRKLAHEEEPRVCMQKLERVLRTLPRRAEPAPCRARLRPAAVIALLLLAGGIAVAAGLGLPAFWRSNPYNLFHNRERVEPEVRTSPLMVADDSGLSSLRFTPLDSAWIEGRLTLTFTLSAAAGRESPLLGQGDGTGFLIWQGEGQSQWVERADLLVCDTDITAYTRRDGADAWEGYPAIQCMEAENGLTLALQFEPDFVTASELAALTDARGRLPLRLELWVYDAQSDACASQSVLLSVCAPTEEERMEMNP